MLAVVPCQWRRIIGSSETLTSPVFKKLFNRLFFHQRRCQNRKKSPFCCFNHRNKPPGGILMK
ncbi:hypothetical protein C0Q87_13240 [Klebsiella aerogenes]|nr:hypothetical protein CRN78_00630 [Klebsiella aerogenes]ATX85567.1 hypothetical protein AM345_01080 [Klebsiella aerogenes]ATY05519.1 hypothetical protein AM336_07985 [Klebsiella aerogenes]AUY89056.1 hypothetical protein AL497_25345 [Klebsiella aerogenes]AUZ16884.1 hypothetical protein AL511_25750 [Klebsiella aerogenes]